LPQPLSTWISTIISNASISFVHFGNSFYCANIQKISIWIYTDANYKIFINSNLINTFIEDHDTLARNNISPCWCKYYYKLEYYNWQLDVQSIVYIQTNKKEPKEGMFIVIYNSYNEILEQ